MLITPSAALGIAAVALGMVLTPGPNMIYLVSRSITQGHKAALISLTGVGTAMVVYVIATAAGLATVFTLVPALYLALKLAGAAYLLYLAWNAVKPGGSSAFAPKELQKDPPRKLYSMGFLTSLLNPKIAIIYVSLLPQFIDTDAPVAAQSVQLGLIQVAIAVTFNGLIALSAGSIAGFLARKPLWLRVQRYLMGTVLAGLALKLAFEKARPA